MRRRSRTPDPYAFHRPSREVIHEFNDRGTLWLLEDPQNVRGLLQILEPALAEDLDFGRAARVNRSLIPADLRKLESDLIYDVPYRAEESGEVWVYVLLEHQSQPDRSMGLRLYLYMGEMWDSMRRAWEDANVPAEERHLRPIIPIVFYTGEHRWTSPIGLASMMALPRQLGRFAPEWETLLLPLHQTSPETLIRHASAVGWAMRALQAQRAPFSEMERVLGEAMTGLEGLSEEQTGQWLRAAWYLTLLMFHRRGEQELIELVQERARQSKFHVREEIVNVGATLAEIERKRGEARGRALGEAEGRRQALVTVLTRRFGALPEEVEAAVAAADAATLDAWLAAAATAAALSDVGIVLPPEAPSG
jgi:hypothetical protein